MNAQQGELQQHQDDHYSNLSPRSAPPHEEGASRKTSSPEKIPGHVPLQPGSDESSRDSSIDPGNGRVKEPESDAVVPVPENDPSEPAPAKKT